MRNRQNDMGTVANIKEYFQNLDFTWKLVGGTFVVGVTTICGWKLLQNNKPKKEFPRNTVILHNLGRAPHVPSLTPFAIKLETYLRLARIRHENCHDMRQSPKGKWPWIEFNGKTISDSEFGIEFLNSEFNVDLNKHLTEEQKGAGRALQKMAEENLYWGLALDRWIFNKSEGNVCNALKIPMIFSYMFGRKIKASAYGQGIGRHTQEEIKHISRLDMQALSNYLGKKKFLFGDEPSQYDCAIFGLLAMCRWEHFNGWFEKMTQEFPNLCEYCDNMKAKVWPDWDECTTMGGTREATK